MGECAWTRQICKEMEKCGAYILPLTGSAASNGLPDRMVIHKNWQGLIEFKAEDTPLRTNQGITMNEILRRAPGFAWIVRKPNLIQRVLSIDSRHYDTYGEFDGTGRSLLTELARLSTNNLLCPHCGPFCDL